MTTTTLFQRLTQRAVKKQQTAAEAFSELSAAVLAGEDVSDDSAASILESAGKSAADLERAVELLAQRRTWQKTVEDAAGCRPRIVEIGKRFEEIASITIAHREKLAAEERELDLERNALQAAIVGADRAAEKLRKTCPD
jgi:hypothetical protein